MCGKGRELAGGKQGQAGSRQGGCRGHKQGARQGMGQGLGRGKAGEGKAAGKGKGKGRQAVPARQAGAQGRHLPPTRSHPLLVMAACVVRGKKGEGWGRRWGGGGWQGLGQVLWAKEGGSWGIWW